MENLYAGRGDRLQTWQRLQAEVMGKAWEMKKAGVTRGTPATRTLSSRFTLGQRPSDPGKMREGGDGMLLLPLGGGGWRTSSAYPAKVPWSVYSRTLF